jgi:hypothetical protein
LIYSALAAADVDRMRCSRCEYVIGFMDTRCRVCGKAVPRIRSSIIAGLSLMSGLTLGWFLIVAYRL